MHLQCHLRPELISPALENSLAAHLPISPSFSKWIGQALQKFFFFFFFLIDTKPPGRIIFGILIAEMRRNGIEMGEGLFEFLPNELGFLTRMKKKIISVYESDKDIRFVKQRNEKL